MSRLTSIILLLLIVATLGWAADTNETQVEILAKSTMSWDGSTLPQYGEGQPEVTILKIVIPPKTKLAMHKHPVINAGVILEGELTVVTDKEEVLHLKAGDAIIEVVNKMHYGKNEGDEPVELIIVYAGIENVPISVKPQTFDTKEAQ